MFSRIICNEHCQVSSKTADEQRDPYMMCYRHSSTSGVASAVGYDLKDFWFYHVDLLGLTRLFSHLLELTLNVEILR